MKPTQPRRHRPLTLRSLTLRPLVLRPLILGALTSVPLALAAALLAGCASLAGGGVQGGDGQGGQRPQVGDPMPDIAVDEFWKRKEIRMSAKKGKVVLLDIWASWCVPCKDEMPALDELAARLGDQGVEIIAVSIDEDRTAAEQFLKTRKRWALT